MVRYNRGLTANIGVKITPDLHSALIEYVEMMEAESFDDNPRKGAPYASRPLADYVRHILHDFLTAQLGREIKIYEIDDDYKNTL